MSECRHPVVHARVTYSERGRAKYARLVCGKCGARGPDRAVDEDGKVNFPPSDYGNLSLATFDEAAWERLWKETPK